MDPNKQAEGNSQANFQGFLIHPKSAIANHVLRKEGKSLDAVGEIWLMRVCLGPS